MLRSLVHVCVVLMLILQGVAQAGAHVVDSAPEQHCAGHEADRGDTNSASGFACDCCPDGALASNGGCAALCAVIATLPSDAADIPRIAANSLAEFVATVRINPAYLPPTPPPIS